VKHLHENGIPMAIGTGSTRHKYFQKTSHLGDFFEIGNYFSHVVTSDDPEVKRGKPAPDTFLVCANRFEVDTNGCGKGSPKDMSNVLVFEDSPVGVAAAISGGMQVVMIPDPRVGEKDKAKATIVIESMEGFQPHLFSLPPFL